MASRSDKSPSSAADGTDSCEDLHLLLECLHFQQSCPSSQRQALTTIAAMCASSARSRDQFRSSGGLSYVLDLLLQTHSTELQQTALYTLGCATERNVVNQMKLCDGGVFPFLSQLLCKSSSDIPVAMTTTAAYLASCLMISNGQGQNAARETKLLQQLVSLFKSHLPLPRDQGASAANKSASTSLELWTSVCNALCTAANNPQNEVNQCLCSQVLPAALSLLHLPTSHPPQVLRSTVSLITSCIANNDTCQNRLRVVGGLQVLVSTLKGLLTPSPSSSHELTELSVHIVKAISASALGNADNSKLLCSGGTVPLLLSLLRHETHDSSAKLNVIMCLGMLTEEIAASQRQVIENGGLPLLLKCMSESKDQELQKASMYVMQCCLYQNSQTGPISDDNQISVSISRLDNLLEPKARTTSPVCETLQGINQEALKVLDSRKLPVSDRVSNWLKRSTQEKTSSVPTLDTLLAAGPQISSDLLEKMHALQLLQTVGLAPAADAEVGSFSTAQFDPTVVTSTLPMAFLGDPTQLQLQNLKAAYLAARTHAQRGEKLQNGREGKKGVERMLQGSKAEKTVTQDTSLAWFQEDEGKQSGEEKRADVVAATRKVGPARNIKTAQEKVAHDLERGSSKGQRASTVGANASQPEKEGGDDRCAQEPGKTQVSFVCAEDSKRSEANVRELERERELREELEKLERELAEEKTKRHQLEKKLSFVSETEQQTQHSSADHTTTTISKTDRGAQPVLTRKGKLSEPRICSASKPQSHAVSDKKLTDSLTNPAKPQRSSGHAKHTSVKCSQTPVSTNQSQKKLQPDVVQTPSSSRTNVRYASSSSVFRAPRFPVQHKQSEGSKTCGNPQSLSSFMAGKHARSGHTQPSHTEGSNREPANQENCMHANQHFKSHAHTSSGRSKNHLSSKLPNSDSHVLSPSSSACEHHCLGCKPRLKCHLITSRNFIKLLLVDHFTCAYHRRLVRLRNRTNALPPSSVTVRPMDFVSQMEAGSHSQPSCSGLSSQRVIHNQQYNERRNQQFQQHSGSHTGLPHGNAEHIPQQTNQSNRELFSVPNQAYCSEDSKSDTESSSDSENDNSGPAIDLPATTTTYATKPTSRVVTVPPQNQHQVARHRNGKGSGAHRKILPHPSKQSGSGHRYYTYLSRVTNSAHTQCHAPPKHSKSSFPSDVRTVMGDVTNSRQDTAVYDYCTPEKAATKYPLPKRQPCRSNPKVHLPSKKPVAFTREEEGWVMEGVRRMGRRWRHILAAYPFHPSRTTVDLKDKHRNLMAKGVVV